MDRRSVFEVCARIDEGDTTGEKSVMDEAYRLSSGPLRGLRVGVVHGRQHVSERDDQMQKFASGELDVLVSTTVVEVGVDVPEATVMMIEGADRFGLAQLHQLRGRVGRGAHASFCFLMPSDGGRVERLQVLEQSDDGFYVAEQDLHMRGPGNILGLDQSGVTIFQVARTTDFELMTAAREAAERLLAVDPELKTVPELQKIVQKARETSHGE